MTSPTAVLNRNADLVEAAAGRFIAGLQEGFLADLPSAVSSLAQLRRGAGKLPGDVPELWGVTGVEQLLGDDTALDDDQWASRAEGAYFLAVTLYALHQQSQSGPMHQWGVDLGQAVRQLMPHGEIDEPVRRRFVRVGTAATPEILAYRLREVVSLLRAEGVPLDYGRLAGQLYRAQTPDGMSQARRTWGRHFHTHTADDNDTPTNEDTT